MVLSTILNFPRLGTAGLENIVAFDVDVVDRDDADCSE